MAAARPTPDGAPSPRVDGGPTRGGKVDDAAWRRWRRQIRRRRGWIWPPRGWIRCLHDGSGRSKPSGDDDGSRRWRWRLAAGGRRPALVEAVVGDAAGSCGGRRAREAAVAAIAEAWPMMAQGDVAQLATGDGCTARRSGRGRW
ncbi:hypothetical protein [Oryza sativa Japonica Group]|uniref:Uncharacterized protein n=1 Tax=Oryza sativa subsp. japonica TaxID=39947 RepID=Q5QM10_ORYSJ|nr:hypothetical protein [Oryza sativa Japonica Group]